MASTDARPVPRKNVAYRVYFAIRKNDGSLISTWAGQDSEISQDGGNFADCTNEATEIQTSGTGYLDLTSSEMNADSVVLLITVTNDDALPLVITLYPEESGDYRVDASDIRDAIGLANADLDTQLSTIDDYLDTEIAAIKAKTDNLPNDPADASDIATAFNSIDAKIDTIDDYIDTEIAAIKAKTDNLPATPAAVGSAMTLDSSEDIYHADINVTVAGSTNEYTAIWYKNGIRITAGITSPAIQVVLRSDGSDLIAETSMTEIGSTGSYKYDEATNVISTGEAALVIVSATIDTETRSFARVVSRDA